MIRRKHCTTTVFSHHLPLLVRICQRHRCASRLLHSRVPQEICSKLTSAAQKLDSYTDISGECQD